MWAYKQQLPQNNVRRWQTRLWTQRLLTPKGTAEHRQPTEGGEIIASCYWPFIWRLYKVQNSTLENQISHWASPWLQQTLLKRSTSNSTEKHSPSSAIREWKSALSWESISPNQSGHHRERKRAPERMWRGPLNCWWEWELGQLLWKSMWSPFKSAKNGTATWHSYARGGCMKLGSYVSPPEFIRAPLKIAKL